MNWTTSHFLAVVITLSLIAGCASDQTVDEPERPVTESSTTALDPELLAGEIESPQSPDTSGAMDEVAAPANAVASTPSVAPTSDQPWSNGAIATDHPAASRAGQRIMQRGGNAVDAAVAASFTLSVVRPYSCGLGGGGFMLVHRPAGPGFASPTAVAINYRETCPAGIGPDTFGALRQQRGDDAPPASRVGAHAVGVPGTVAGLLFALDRYGTLDRRTVLQPAINAARNGFRADADFVRAVGRLRERMNQSERVRQLAQPIWKNLCNSGDIAIGTVIKQPKQAEALELIAEHGMRAFYHGPIAQAISETIQQHGGVLKADDLAQYGIQTVEPLRGTFLGHDVLTMPPPSSGGVATLQILGILQQHMSTLAPTEHNTPLYIHLLTEAFKHAFADRARWLADATFVDVPVAQLTSSRYIANRANAIALPQTKASESYGTTTPPPDDAGTSHLSVVDENGMAVACTETINLTFGSLVYVEEFGFALNNEMNDFTTIAGQVNAFGLKQSDRNLPEPGKRPLSSMSPTIVLRDGEPFLVAGASGGPRIITATVQCLLNSVLFDMMPEHAVRAARFHHQWLPDELQFEDRWVNENVIKALRTFGHATGRRDRIGVVQLIRVDDDGIRAASDPRKGGQPAGY